MKKNKRKKPVKKMLSGGDIFGSISPVFGAITGKGAIGDLVKDVGGTGMLGLAGYLASERLKDKDKKKIEEELSGAGQSGGSATRATPASTMKGATRMKSGGSVKCPRDGMAQRGKTRARMK